MDVIILAAGKSERLAGIVPPYHKPMLVVNGKPMIRQAFELASIVQKTGDQTIVVVAPENTSAISSVLPLEALLIVQRVATGPLAALQMGLRLVTSERVMVLMADNVSSSEDIRQMYGPRGNVVGIRSIASEDVERFTYLSNGTWVEKTPPPDPEGRYSAWCGPLILDTEQAKEAASVCYTGLISEALNHLITSRVLVSTIDIGVPEALV